ncbi:hypothetical protein Lalb_Chr06g0171131 [Lupinus albus]|uniref:Uncharacterized protein n=1 Tax=Lupinus albus TaxID=3870 RepID=A0A6A4QF68_LUPAL|nr:hypothetical protein Lalb_Chr06g0171131 [Lupinus albus]
MHEKTQKWFERVKDKVASNFDGGSKKRNRRRRRRKCLVLRKMKEISCAVLDFS